MTEKSIQKALFKKFQSHLYKFVNVYYFDNESDWLSFLPSGFCYEIEIKISRADFKKDFLKPRHEIHTKNNSGSKYYIQRNGLERIIDPSWELCKAFPELVESQEYRTYSRRSPMHMEVRCYFNLSSKIEIREVKNQSLPNKFFYAVPEGLVKVEEVPDYAGLLYVKENGEIQKVKDGKFIHKEFLKPEKVFQKTYYAYENMLRQNLKAVV